ncbi:MAG: acyl carrier protein [Butyrivibrio sp.]
MTRKEIEDKLREIFRLAVSNPSIAPEDITLEHGLTTDLEMTSMGLLYLVIAVEESFGIRFDDVGLADFVTVKDVVDYIYDKKG